jgi:hypothetical protein
LPPAVGEVRGGGGRQRVGSEAVWRGAGGAASAVGGVRVMGGVGGAEKEKEGRKRSGSDGRKDGGSCSGRLKKDHTFPLTRDRLRGVLKYSKILMALHARCLCEHQPWR